MFPFIVKSWAAQCSAHSQPQQARVEVEAAQSDQGAWMVNVPPGISLDGPGVMKILMNCKL